MHACGILARTARHSCQRSSAVSAADLRRTRSIDRWERPVSRRRSMLAHMHAWDCWQSMNSIFSFLEPVSWCMLDTLPLVTGCCASHAYLWFWGIYVSPWRPAPQDLHCRVTYKSGYYPERSIIYYLVLKSKIFLIFVHFSLSTRVLESFFCPAYYNLRVSYMSKARMIHAHTS